MTARHALTITSTSDLTPAGILGYAKGIAVTVGSILVAIAEIIPEDQPWKRYLQAAILICTIIATISIPNPVKPVQVVDADPDPIVGVVNPPVNPEAGIE